MHNLLEWIYAAIITGSRDKCVNGNINYMPKENLWIVLKWPCSRIHHTDIIVTDADKITATSYTHS